MNAKFFGAVLSVLVITTIFVALMSSFSSFTSAANTTEQNTTSDANISYFYAIYLTSNLSDGVHFGIVEPNSTDNSAEDNNVSDNTLYGVIVSADSNTPVQITIRDDENLTSGINTIPNTGYTYAAVDNDSTAQGVGATQITTSFVEADDSVAEGNTLWFSFWLDIPGSQPSGDYQNIVSFHANRI